MLENLLFASLRFDRPRILSDVASFHEDVLYPNYEYYEFCLL